MEFFQFCKNFICRGKSLERILCDNLYVTKNVIYRFFLEAKSSPHQKSKFYFVKLDFSFGKTRRIMLKISLKQGQYVNIGDNIRVVYVGGTGNHGRLMIDAPKEVKIARSTVEQNPERRKDTYYPEPAISKEAQDEIKKILWNERMKAEAKRDAEKMKE